MPQPFLPLYVNNASDLLDVFEEADEDYVDIIINDAVFRGNAERFADLVVEGLLHVARKAGMEAALNRPKDVRKHQAPPPRARK